MNERDLEAIAERLEMANVGEIQRDGNFFYELDPCSGENRWWASISTQHGHLSEVGQCLMAVLFQHVPADARPY